MFRFDLWRSRSANPRTRGAAAFKLIGSLQREALQRVIELLKDPEPSVAVDAARALGRKGDPAAIGPLIEALSAPVELLRENAGTALRLLDPQWPRSDTARAMLPSLVAALVKSDSASWTNCRLPLLFMAEQALEPLADVLRKGPSEARRRALSVLKATANREAVAFLIQALPDLEEEDVRNDVLRLLEALDREWPESEAARAVAPRLLVALESGGAATVGTAVAALERVREPRCMDALFSCRTSWSLDAGATPTPGTSGWQRVVLGSGTVCGTTCRGSRLAGPR